MKGGYQDDRRVSVVVDHSLASHPVLCGEAVRGEGVLLSDYVHI